MIDKFISGLFNPVAKVIDDLTLSPEEKKKLEITLTSIQNETATKIAQIKSEIILAEAKGNYLQRSWRPILVLGLLLLLYLHCLGMLSNPLPEWFGTLFTSLVSLYVIGRSAEKVAPRVLNKK